jgi:hypothetical protein
MSRCHQMAMNSLKVFAASLIFMTATLLPAQRAGAGAGVAGHPSGGGAGMAAHGNRVTIRSGNGHRGHNHGNGYGAGWYPWYGGYADYWDDPWAYGDYGPDGPPNEPGYQSQSNGAAPPVIVMQSSQRMAPAAPAPSPKLVEVPLDGPATPAKEQPPAMFVLQNGQHIESDRYTVSDKSVTIDVGRQQRTIPLSDLDMNETMAANRQRGVDIAFPRDSNSLFISF